MRDWLLGVYRTCNIVHRNCFLYMCISSSQTTSHRQSSFLIYIYGNKEDTSLAWRFWITFSLQKSLWLVQRTQCVFFNIEPSKSKNVVCLNTMKLCAWLLLSAYCNLLLLCCLAMLLLFSTISCKNDCYCNCLQPSFYSLICRYIKSIMINGNGEINI